MITERKTSLVGFVAFFVTSLLLIQAIEQPSCRCLR